MIVLNLLPPEEKESLFIRRINQYLVIFGSGLVITLLILIILLGLSLILIKIKAQNTTTELTNTQKKLQVEGFEGLQTKILQINGQIQAINTIQSKYKYYSQPLNQLTQVIPKDIWLRSLSLGQNQIIIKGFAPTREAALTLQQDLEKSADFENIESPTTNLLRPANVDFMFSFNIKENTFYRK